MGPQGQRLLVENKELVICQTFFFPFSIGGAQREKKKIPYILKENGDEFLLAIDVHKFHISIEYFKFIRNFTAGISKPKTNAIVYPLIIHCKECHI